MSDLSTDKLSIEADLRQGSVDVRKDFKGKFPFDAFTMTDPAYQANPLLTLIDPWRMWANMTSVETADGSGDVTISSTDRVHLVKYTRDGTNRVCNFPDVTSTDHYGQILGIQVSGAGTDTLTYSSEGSQTIGGFTDSDWVHEGTGIVWFFGDQTNWVCLSNGVWDKGSNANGDWEKYTNSTLKQWHTSASALTANTASGNIFINNADYTFTFPVAFAAVPKVYPDVVAISNIPWAIDRSHITLSTTQYDMRIAASTTGTQAYPEYLAIGFWRV